MRTAPATVAALLLASALAACVPPRERLDGRSADGRTRVALDLRPTSVDSVQGSGVLRVAGRPVPVRLRGRWNDVGNGVRNLEATLQADTMAGERWALQWSASELIGSLREDGSSARVLLANE